MYEKNECNLTIEKKSREMTSLCIFCEAEMKEKILKHMQKSFKKLSKYDSRYLEDTEKLEKEEERLKAGLDKEQIKILNNIMEYHRFCVDNACILAYISGILDGKKSLRKIRLRLKDILFI